MRKFREGMDRRQLSILPASIEEYVPAGDIVRYVDALVDEFDLSAIESKYSYQGRPAYNPRVLVKLLVYGKLRGFSTSRELAQAARENMRFMFLAGSERPDFRTLSDFRKNHHRELAGLLAQTIAIGIEEKLITLDYVAVDGTKLRGFAGTKSFKTPAQLQKELAELEAEIAGSLKADIAKDEEQDRHHGDGDGESHLPKDLQDKQTLRERLRGALTHYQDIEGEKPRKVSVTDPECRYMLLRGIFPSYNAQLAVDGDSMMAVAGYTTTACSDSSELEPVVAEIERNTGRVPTKLAADKGYSYRAALNTLETKGIEGYISQCDYRRSAGPIQFEYHSETDTFTCRNNRVLTLKFIDPATGAKRYQCHNCTGCEYRSECAPKAKTDRARTLLVPIYQEALQRMNERIQTPLGERMRRLRAATVETVFGTIKHAMRFRHFTVRGNAKVNSVWQFQLAAYNVAKLVRHFQATALRTSG